MTAPSPSSIPKKTHLSTTRKGKACCGAFSRTVGPSALTRKTAEAPAAVISESQGTELLGTKLRRVRGTKAQSE